MFAYRTSRRKRLRTRAAAPTLLAAVAAILLPACARQAPHADTIFAGRFLTLAPAQPTASAIAILSGRKTTAPERLRDLTVQMTVVGGEVVFRHRP